jgi:arsenate reductase-like glutaredoxin family protein
MSIHPDTHIYGITECDSCGAVRPVYDRQIPHHVRSYHCASCTTSRNGREYPLKVGVVYFETPMTKIEWRRMVRGRPKFEAKETAS